MLGRVFSNTGALIRFILRRERVKSTIWILCLVGISLAVPPALADLYGGAMDRMAMAESMKNPAMIAMLGPIYGAENYTNGAMQANMMLLFTIVAVAIMNIFLVIHHTRGDEERGRVEVIRSLPVGRLSNLGATMTVALGVNTVLALLTGFGLRALGIESVDLGGSMLFGVCLGVSGLFFAAVAAVFAQLCVSRRGAVGYSFVFLGICYIARAMGDINNETLARLSPLGLILRTQAYTENAWWPVFVILLETIALTGLAFWLNAIRDMDQGFIPSRPGRKTASHLLSSSFGLSFRLLRNTMIAWVIGMLLLGLSYGSVMGDLDAFIQGSEVLMQALPTVAGHSRVEMFISLLMSVLAMGGTIPVLTAMLGLKKEERRGRTEHLLARSVSRTRLMAGYLTIAMAGSFVMLLAAAFGLWAAGAAVMENPVALGSLLKSIMVYLPAVWVMIGIAALLTGFCPDKTGIAWGYLGGSFFAVYLGQVMQFPDWVRKLSPFGYIPKLPVDEVDSPTLLILTLIAAALIVAGFVFYRRRDVRTS